MADENPNMTKRDLQIEDLKNNLVQVQGSLFDCIICMELAKEPVVTCCGHLFCWPCLYRWLSRRSSANQCPICKGEVTVKNVTPIYGHDSNNNKNTKVDNGGTKNIPPRPEARRNESARRCFPLTSVDQTNVRSNSDSFHNFTRCWNQTNGIGFTYNRFL